MEVFAPQVVVLLPPLEEFTAPVYNQVHQEQMVAGEMTQNIIENSAVQEQAIVREIPRLCVARSAQRRLRSPSHHSSFDLTGRDLTEHMMRSSPSAVLFHYHRRVWDCSSCHWDNLLHAFDYNRAQIDRVRETLLHCFRLQHSATGTNCFFCTTGRWFFLSLKKSLMRLCTTRHWHCTTVFFKKYMLVLSKLTSPREIDWKELLAGIMRIISQRKE